MKKVVYSITIIALISTSISCTKENNLKNTNTVNEKVYNTPISAFDDFIKESDVDYGGVTISYNSDKTNVTISSSGYPNHESPYWPNTTIRTLDGRSTETALENHPLFREPSVTNYNSMSPGNIDDQNRDMSLTVSLTPGIANYSTATDLGAIGISISGAPIYNDEEGNGILTEGTATSMDFSGAHVGPTGYHYHLEPKEWSDNDSKLIGIIADGFLLYGRGSHEEDGHILDQYNGHVGTTQHSNGEEIYHYHINSKDNITVDGTVYYINFPYDYAGIPQTIN